MLHVDLCTAFSSFLHDHLRTCLGRTTISSSRRSSPCCRRNRRYFTSRLPALPLLSNGAPRDPISAQSPSSPSPTTPLLLYLRRPRVRRDKSKHALQVASQDQTLSLDADGDVVGRGPRGDLEGVGEGGYDTEAEDAACRPAHHTAEGQKRRSRQGVRGRTKYDAAWRIRRGQRAFVWRVYNGIASADADPVCSPCSTWASGGGDGAYTQLRWHKASICVTTP
ncbi:hypothetical protein BJ912DRAFT_969148 [Pholiota molesta]|nr:hypothetical protein BJ912DRAFT_969148 [Pholiota molesta]